MSQTEAPSGGLGSLLGDLAGDLQRLLRGEIALARSELDQKTQRIAAAGIWIGGGALVAFAGLVVFLLGLAALLSTVIPAWLAMFVVGALIVVAGGLIARSAMAGLTLKTLTPERTAENLKKDAQMLKDHT